MMKKIIYLIVFSSLSLFAAESEKPQSVLVIGGGPAGLATAIEAKMNGFDVTIIEKREKYTRNQTIFLLESSLKLLQQWKIKAPKLQAMDIGEGERIGVVRINYLEKKLIKKARELNIDKIIGTFQGFASKNKALILSPENKEIQIAYDIIVGADGSHSSVRDALGIKADCLGTGSGAFTIIPDPCDKLKQVDATLPIKIENGFIRRIKVPYTSIVFTQTHKDASKASMEKALKAQGWTHEASAVAENKVPVVTDVPVLLQRAAAFSDEKASAILVGDAAATASFFQGMGANTALKTVEIAGQFFKEIKEKNEAAYRHYNEDVKKAADALIEDSAFLFR